MGPMWAFRGGGTDGQIILQTGRWTAWMVGLTMPHLELRATRHGTLLGTVLYARVPYLSPYRTVRYLPLTYLYARGLHPTPSDVPLSCATLRGLQPLPQVGAGHERSVLHTYHVRTGSSRGGIHPNILGGLRPRHTRRFSIFLLSAGAGAGLRCIWRIPWPCRGKTRRAA
jgi:hypothetical protein